MLQKEQGAEFPHGVIILLFERDFETRGCSLQQRSEAARLLGNSHLRPCSTGSTNKSNISFCLLQLHRCFITVCSLAVYVIRVLCVHNTM